MRAQLPGLTLSILKLARATSKNAYNIALSDWFHPPVIREVSQQADGKGLYNGFESPAKPTLEQGQAAQINNTWWELETTTSIDGKVIVKAFDLAGNCTKQEA
ncbi:MAG: hypothetical protein M3R47_12865 [Chloroflexota bacterium]|nr:hypothetical protein [Chloroflexota bacterium]